MSFSSQHDSLFSSSPTVKQHHGLAHWPSEDKLHALRLIWHLCHLSNTITSNIGAYLSLETLARDTTARGPLGPYDVAYEPAMRAHVLMLSEINANLITTRDQLVQTSMHSSCWEHTSYRNLISAANVIPEIVDMLSSRRDSPENDCKLSEDLVQEVRQRYHEATGYCHGNESKGILGWNACFGAIQKLMDL